MSKIVGDTTCPSCVEKGGDRTGNHLILFEDGGAYCNRCGHKDNWKEKNLTPKPRKEITDEELKEVIDEFLSCKTEAWPKRKLKKSTTQRYNCRVGVSHSDKSVIGSYLIPHYDRGAKLVGYQVRLVEEKRFFNVGRPKQAALFGQQLLPKGNIKRLYICESAIDTMSVYQVIEDAWLKGNITAKPNVVGLPHGTGCAVDLLSKNSDVLDRVQEIVLVLDNDKAGKEAVDKIAGLYPDIKVVNLPLKDPNEMLMSGRGEELAKLCQFSQESYKLDGMADISEFYEEIITPPTMGLSFPWKSMDKLMFGQRPQQIIGIAGGVGMGKTALKYDMAVHNAIQHKVHSTVFDLESGVANTGKLMASRVVGKPLHLPNSDVNPDIIKKGLDPLQGYVSLYKHKGSRDWAEIKRYIRHSVIVNNSRVVYLDPITALVAHLSSSEANDVLNNIFSDVSAMVNELDFTFVYFAHLNPPKTGAPHERGGKVMEAHMTGSRAMMKWSTHIWGLEGNKDPDLPDHERNVRKMVLLKDRDYGQVGSFYLFYDHDTTRLLERFA